MPLAMGNSLVTIIGRARLYGILLRCLVADVFTPDGTPKTRVRVRREIAKRGRAGDVFLPDRLVPKLRRFWRFKKKRCEGLEAGDPLFCSQSRISAPDKLYRGWIPERFKEVADLRFSLVHIDVDLYRPTLEARP